MTAPPFPLLPIVLGSLGAVPFVLFAAVIIASDGSGGGLAAGLAMISAEIAAVLLKTYAVLILAFMGAIHWGLALPARPNGWQLGLSVLPMLIGWPLIAVHWAQAFGVLALLFLLLLAADFLVRRTSGLRPAYLVLRAALSVTVAASLLSAAAFGPAIADPLGEIRLW